MFMNVSIVENFWKEAYCNLKFCKMCTISIWQSTRFQRQINVNVWFTRAFNVEITSNMHHSKFRFRYEQVIIRAEKIKTQIEAGVIPKLSNIFGSYVNSTSKQHQEKKTWKSHRYFIDFESSISIELSTSNWCLCFDLDLRFIIDEMLTNFLCRIFMSNRWRIDKNVSDGWQHPVYKVG